MEHAYASALTASSPASPTASGTASSPRYSHSGYSAYSHL